jgi:tyrosine-protein kinase Etk/Wzc
VRISPDTPRDPDGYFDPAGLKLIRVLWQWRRFLFVNVVAVAVLAAGVSLLLPNVYRAGATILPPKGESSGLPIQLMDAISGMGNIGVGTSGLRGSSSELLATVLRSRRLADRVIEAENLVAYYDTKSVPQARRVLNEQLAISADGDGLVHIKCADLNPDKAAAIVQAALTALDSINLSLSAGAAAATRRFVDLRLKEVEIELRAAEDAMRRFQEKTGTIALEDQLTVMLQSLALLRVDRMKQEMQLSMLEDQLGKGHRRVQALRERIGTIDRQIGVAEASGDSAATLTAGNAPELTLTSLRLLRQVTVYDQIYQFLRQALEQAIIDEQRDLPTFTILDYPESPDRKWRPLRSFIVVGSGAVAFILLALVIVLRESTRPGEMAEAVGYGAGWRRLAQRARQPVT